MLNTIRNITVWLIGVISVSFILALILTPVLMGDCHGRPSKSDKLDSLQIDIHLYQREYYSNNNKYAKKDEIETALDYGHEDFKKKYGKHAKIYDSKEEFTTDYPELPLCIELGVTTDEFKLLVVGNIDRDKLPNVSFISNGPNRELISDKQDKIVEECMGQ